MVAVDSGNPACSPGYVGHMPILVVGADTAPGEEILTRFTDPRREVRVFVSDEDAATRMRERGIKVATGDVSDFGHIEAAATRCFSVVLIAEAAIDDRERSFANTPDEVLTGWAVAVANSQVRRVIWVSDGPYPETGTAEVASVAPADPNLADLVYSLDGAHSIP